MRPLLALALLLLAPSLAVASAPADSQACAAAIAAADRGSPVPLPLMRAIGIVETGRADPRTRTVEPWPWSVNVGGEGRFYASKADAIVAVRALQTSGVTSIDVGCMQVNLFYHPHAFASLDAAFDPLANARFAARFLAALYRQEGTWPAAAAAYHSQTPALGAAYAERVLAAWPGSGYVAPLLAGRPTPPRFSPLRFPSGRVAVSLNGVAPMRILSLDQIIGRAPARAPAPHG